MELPYPISVALWLKVNAEVTLERPFGGQDDFEIRLESNYCSYCPSTGASVLNMIVDIGGVESSFEVPSLMEWTFVTISVTSSEGSFSFKFQ